jgi:hypothetical protein
MAKQTASTVRAAAFRRKCVKFGEDLLDRVQVGGVFGQEEKLGSCGANELTYGFAFMAAEIVHDHDCLRPNDSL